MWGLEIVESQVKDGERLKILQTLSQWGVRFPLAAQTDQEPATTAAVAKKYFRRTTLFNKQPGVFALE